MTTERQLDTKQAPQTQSPVKDYSKGGRKAKTYVTAGIQQRLDSAAEKATALIEKHIEANTERRRSFKHLAPDIQRAIEYVIDHSVGKARQKIEHSGSVMTYGDLAKSAEQLEKQKPRLLIEVEVPIEAEVKELSNTIVAPEPPKE